jgi:ATP-binding cassette subfamily B protein
MGILILQTLIAYYTIVVTGMIITTLQNHMTGKQFNTFTINDFVAGGYLFPVVCLIAIFFIEIVLKKIKSFVSSRCQHILRVANYREINDLKASLDIARKRSKQFDDVEKKIDELPNSWFTRISFSREVMFLFGEIITFIIFGLSLVSSHPLYIAILVVTTVPMMIAEFTAVNRSWRLSLELIPHHKKRSVLQKAYYGTTSFLQGVMFNQMGTLSKLIQENQDYVLKKFEQLRWSNLQITLGAYLFAMAGLSFVLIHSVWNTVSVGGDLGALTVVIASSRRLQISARDIVLQIANQWLSARGMIIIEKEYFGMKPMLKTENPVNPEFSGSPRIRFEKVCFSYPDRDSLVLKEISFTIEPGSKIAIVGRNGSGKSSLIGLLLRHYDPTSGKIVVGDINLTNITPPVWSNYACALLQDFEVHDRKIGEEIASSRLEEPIDMEKIREAVKFAEFQTIVEEDPNGYDSQIGTEFGGREFSGGEEQRLALARVKYRNTPILILDEPDAKLDPEAAQRLIDNVFALKGVTVIIVTQHVSRATRGDKVIVLNEGEVAEQGKPSELLALGGKYASMFNKDKVRLGG